MKFSSTVLRVIDHAPTCRATVTEIRKLGHRCTTAETFDWVGYALNPHAKPMDVVVADLPDAVADAECLRVHLGRRFPQAVLWLLTRSELTGGQFFARQHFPGESGLQA